MRLGTFDGNETAAAADAVINQSTCLGCGRSETECSHDAISITMDGVDGFKQMIDRIESFVDVS